MGMVAFPFPRDRPPSDSEGLSTSDSRIHLEASSDLEQPEKIRDHSDQPIQLDRLGGSDDHG